MTALSRFLSYPDYLDWKRDHKTFSALNVFEPDRFMMKTPDGLRDTTGARVIEPILSHAWSKARPEGTLDLPLEFVKHGLGGTQSLEEEHESLRSVS